MKILWNTLVYYPFLNLLIVLYKLLGNNLGLATIAIAILVRLVLFPAYKKQMHSMDKMSQIQPKLKKLQKKYKNDQQRLAKEQMKLYKEMGYNPLGCFGSMLPQFIILIAIIQVIRVVTSNDITGIYPAVKEFAFGSHAPVISTTFLNFDLAKTYSAVAKESGYLSIQTLPYIIITILVAIFQYFSTILMQKTRQTTELNKKQKKKNITEPLSAEEIQEKMMQSTNLLLPLMTAFTTLTVPIVLGLYWLIQSAMLILQIWVIDPKKFKEIVNLNFKLTKNGNK